MRVIFSMSSMKFASFMHDFDDAPSRSGCTCARMTMFEQLAHVQIFSAFWKDIDASGAPALICWFRTWILVFASRFVQQVSPLPLHGAHTPVPSSPSQKRPAHGFPAGSADARRAAVFAAALC